MSAHHIYLDYNASTPLRPKVIDAITECLPHFGNPSSIHKHGRTIRASIESARDLLAETLAVRPEQVVFTSGGTEANNFALHTAKARGKNIFVSDIEHESILNVVIPEQTIPVTAEGTIDLDALQNALESVPKGSAFIAVMLANNQTGVIQPIDKVRELAKTYGAELHCDAVTAFTKVPFTYESLGVDTLTLSAHKIGGPKGVGALIVPSAQKLPSFILGGGQEKSHRAGTENVIGIVGFGQAIQQAASDDWDRVAQLRDQLEQSLEAEGIVYGQQSKRLPNTSLIGMPGVSSQKQLMFLDLNGVALSAGSACSSGKVKPSHVLKSMGVDDQASSQVLRVSLGWDTTRDDIETFTSLWLQLYRSLNVNEKRLKVQ